jgi:aryl-alcohol dehydrogenase-like predicted oxidoreductase
LAAKTSDAEVIAAVERLRRLPIGSGVQAQLAIAWCTKHPMVSPVLTGASKVSQVAENFAALDVIPLITDDVKAEIEAAVA